jgi:hypothetical protein
VLVKEFGLVHVGIGAQVMLATHPGLLNEVSEVKTKVKHPLESEEVKGPGNAAPVSCPE